MGAFFVLNEAGEVQPADMETWAAFVTQPDASRIDRTSVGDADVSTVFLGATPSFRSGVPLLFETMIFGGRYDTWMWRWSTRADAVAGHARVVEALRDGEEPEVTR
jgi:hypothetical protein